MEKFIKGQLVALLLLSGAASAALPPVVDGNGKVVPDQQSSSGSVGMYNLLQQLQQEVQQLRGQVEEQAYVIDTLKKRQRDLYLDTDRRIQQLEGSAVSTQQSPATNSGDASVTQQTTAQTAEPSGEADKLAYEKAFSSLKSGRSKQAIVEFSEFTKLFPGSDFLPNALYWLGEASYVNRDYDRANLEFNKVVAKFPTHSKAKDALLKIGFIQYENKKWKEARDSLNNVSKTYQGTTAARLADQRLDRMRQEKR